MSQGMTVQQVGQRYAVVRADGSWPMGQPDAGFATTKAARHWITRQASPCRHEAVIPANGQGGYCRHCGETLA